MAKDRYDSIFASAKAGRIAKLFIFATVFDQ